MQTETEFKIRLPEPKVPTQYTDTETITVRTFDPDFHVDHVWLEDGVPREEIYRTEDLLALAELGEDVVTNYSCLRITVDGVHQSRLDVPNICSPRFYNLKTDFVGSETQEYIDRTGNVMWDNPSIMTTNPNCSACARPWMMDEVRYQQRGLVACSHCKIIVDVLIT